MASLESIPWSKVLWVDAPNSSDDSAGKIVDRYLDAPGITESKLDGKVAALHDAFSGRRTSSDEHGRRLLRRAGRRTAQAPTPSATDRRGRSRAATGSGPAPCRAPRSRTGRRPLLSARCTGPGRDAAARPP